MMKLERPQQPPTPVRLPDDLKQALKEHAGENDRSLNGEIVYRLRLSLKGKRAVAAERVVTP